jgi:transcriptional regulator with XRE-family HTH domain
MEVDSLPWDDVSALIAEHGNQQNIARRVKQWREENGWSTVELAKLMNMSQSSIWKIENPDKKSGRREISIGDAIAFARVFKKTLAEILLPDDALAEVEGWSLFRKAAERLNDLRQANVEYEELMGRVRAYLTRRPDLAQRIQQHLEQSQSGRLAQVREVWENDGGVKSDEPFFDEYATKYGSTPAIQAALDALGSYPLDHALWSKTKREQA